MAKVAFDNVVLDDLDSLRELTEDATAGVEQYKAAQDRTDAVRSDLDAAEQAIADAQGGIADNDSAIAGVAGDLSAETQARIDDVQDEASARADAILAEKNAREAAVTQEQSIRQSADDSLAASISSVAAGTGEQFDYTEIWHFDSDTGGWSGGAQTADGYLRPDNAASDAHVTSPTGVAADASVYRYVKLRIIRTGSPAWKGELRWKNPGDSSWSGPATKSEPAFDASGMATFGWETVNWSGTIDQIRVDLSDAQTATDYFEIDWIAVGRPSPGASEAALQDEREARITGDSANATARETLAAQMRGNYQGTDPAQLTQGLVFQEREARVSEDSAISTNLSALEATVTDPSTGLDSKASLTALSQAQADDQSARATLDQELSAKISRADALIRENATTRVTNDDALAAIIESVESSISDSDARIATEEVARTTEDEALSGRIVTVQSSLRDSDARITREETTRATETSSLAQRASAIESSVGDNEAAILAEETARSDADSALSDTIEVLRTDVSGNAARIESEQKARSDANSAFAEDFNSLNAAVTDPSTGLPSKASQSELAQAQVDDESARTTLSQNLTAAFEVADSQILSTSKSYADTDSASAQTAQTLETQFGGNASQALSYTVSEVDSDLAVTQTFNSISATLNDPNTGLDSKASSTDLNQAQADNQSARTTLSQDLTAAFGSADSAVLTDAKSYADTDSAAAQTTQTLEAQFGGNAAGALNHTISEVDSDLAVTSTFNQLTADFDDASSQIQLEAESRATDDTALGGIIESVESSISDSDARIANEELARTTENEALSARLYTTQATLRDASARIQREEITRAADDEAASLRVETVEAAVDDNKAAIADEAFARADADSALTSTLQTLSADVGGNAAAIQSERRARADANSALSQEFTNLDAVVTDPQTGLASKASLNELSQAESDAQSARSTLSQNLTAAFQSADGALQQDINTKASQTALDTVESDALSARGTLENNVTAAYQAADDGLQGQIDNRATINQLQTVESDADSATSQLRTDVTAALGEDVAGVSISYKARIDGVNDDLQAQYTLAVTGTRPDGTQIVGGAQLGTDGQTVDLVLSLNNLAIQDPGDNGSLVYPFIYSSGKTVIQEAVIDSLTFDKLQDGSGNLLVQNGRIKGQFIEVESGHITNAKIANGAIDNAKIGNAAVDTLQIKGNAVTLPILYTNDADVNPGNNTWTEAMRTATIYPQSQSAQVTITGVYSAFSQNAGSSFFARLIVKDLGQSLIYTVFEEKIAGAYNDIGGSYAIPILFDYLNGYPGNTSDGTIFILEIKAISNNGGRNQSLSTIGYMELRR